MSKLKSTKEMHNELTSLIHEQKSRISQLEKQNSELREALQEITCMTVGIHNEYDLYDAKNVAEQALNTKDK